MKGTRSESRTKAPDFEETKEHILSAGREIMLAARGALRFCKDYADATASPSSKMQLAKFFGKAIDVADELSRGLISASTVAHRAHSVAAPIFDAIGREMRAEAEKSPAECHTPKKAARKAVRRQAPARAARRRKGAREVRP